MSARQRERRQPNVLILDSVKGWGLAYRENLPANAEAFRYMGRLVCPCVPDGDGGLKAVELPAKTASSPERLYQARRWPQAKSVFGVVRTGWEKLETKLWIPAIGILSLLVFLMFSELKG